jgi:hypothetical protein
LGNGIVAGVHRAAFLKKFEADRLPPSDHDSVQVDRGGSAGGEAPQRLADASAGACKPLFFRRFCHPLAVNRFFRDKMTSHFAGNAMPNASLDR